MSTIGRKRLTLEDGSRPWEARYLMEQKLDRKLGRHEIVHHIDEDPTNNDIDNLELLTRAEHASLHHKNTRLGETHPLSKLSDNERREIRRRYAAGNVTHRELAQEYEVSQACICLTINRRRGGTVK